MIPINADNSRFQMSGSGVQTKQQSYYGRDGLIHSLYIGDQTGAKVKKAGIELTALINKVRANGRRALILTDITNLGDVNLAARKIGLEIMKELDYDHLAIIGCNYISAGLVNLMIMASGRGFKIRVFDNQKEAKRWLLSK